MDGNGGCWAGMIITSDCGSFPHSLLSTSKLLIFIEGSIWSGLLWDASKSSKYARNQFGVQVSCYDICFQRAKKPQWKGAAGWTHQITVIFESPLASFFSVEYQFHYFYLKRIKLYVNVNTSSPLVNWIQIVKTFFHLLHHWFTIQRRFNYHSPDISPQPPEPRECFAGHASLPPQLCSHAHPPPSSGRMPEAAISGFQSMVDSETPKWLWLVVYLPSWKNMKVSWDDDSLYIYIYMEK